MGGRGGSSGLVKGPQPNFSNNVLSPQDAQDFKA